MFKNLVIVKKKKSTFNLFLTGLYQTSISRYIILLTTFLSIIVNVGGIFYGNE